MIAMRPAYRIVQFMPNPVHGFWRIPFAALVRTDGGIQVVTTTHLPGPEILGRNESAALLQMIVRRLQGCQDFDRLPATVGPHAVLEPPREVPAAVSDPAAWVRRFVLPTYRPSREMVPATGDDGEDAGDAGDAV